MIKIVMSRIIGNIKISSTTPIRTISMAPPLQNPNYDMAYLNKYQCRNNKGNQYRQSSCSRNNPSCVFAGWYLTMDYPLTYISWQIRSQVASNESNGIVEHSNAKKWYPCHQKYNTYKDKGCMDNGTKVCQIDNWLTERFISSRSWE